MLAVASQCYLTTEPSAPYLKLSGAISEHPAEPCRAPVSTTTLFLCSFPPLNLFEATCCLTSRYLDYKMLRTIGSHPAFPQHQQPLGARPNAALRWSPATFAALSHSKSAATICQTFLNIRQRFQGEVFQG